jgi:hypothetical protein
MDGKPSALDTLEEVAERWADEGRIVAKHGDERTGAMLQEHARTVATLVRMARSQDVARAMHLTLDGKAVATIALREFQETARRQYGDSSRWAEVMTVNMATT